MRKVAEELSKPDNYGGQQKHVGLTAADPLAGAGPAEVGPGRVTNEEVAEGEGEIAEGRGLDMVDAFGDGDGMPVEVMEGIGEGGCDEEGEQNVDRGEEDRGTSALSVTDGEDAAQPEVADRESENGVKSVPVIAHAVAGRQRDGGDGDEPKYLTELDVALPDGTRLAAIFPGIQTDAAEEEDFGGQESNVWK